MDGAHMDGPLVRLQLKGVHKRFVMHLQGGVVLPVIEGASFQVAAGQCAVLTGPSGTGKSSLLKMIYGNYRTDAGSIYVHDGDATVDVAQATPRRILALRRSVIGYVSQFLSVIPRVSAIDLVAAASRKGNGKDAWEREKVRQAPGAGGDEKTAREAAGALLDRLNIPPRLWDLPPATFSGGEQQRVNIACGFAGGHDILLLDEPTASLDAANRAVVMDMIEEKKSENLSLICKSPLSKSLCNFSFNSLIRPFKDTILFSRSDISFT